MGIADAAYEVGRRRNRCMGWALRAPISMSAGAKRSPPRAMYHAIDIAIAGNDVFSYYFIPGASLPLPLPINNTSHGLTAPQRASLSPRAASAMAPSRFTIYNDDFDALLRLLIRWRALMADMMIASYFWRQSSLSTAPSGAPVTSRRPHAECCALATRTSLDSCHAFYIREASRQLRRFWAFCAAVSDAISATAIGRHARAAQTFRARRRCAEAERARRLLL